MFRPMRRHRQQLSQGDCAAILSRGTSGVLAVAGDGGYPYAVPLSYVYQEGTLFFHCAKAGHKLDALRRCSKASFCVIGQDQVVPEEYTSYYRSVIAFGTVRILEGDDEIRRAIETLSVKYAPEDSPAGRDRVIDRAGKVLSQLSDYPVFTMAQPKQRVTVKRFDLLMVEENAFIAVVMTDNSVVKNKLIHLPDQLSDTQLQLLSAVLNTSFVGLSREEMEEALDKMEAHTAPAAFELISLVVEFAMEVLEDQGRQKVRTAGITHLLEHPEYRSLDKAKPLMNYLSEENENSRLPMNLNNGKSMNILIGPENVNDALKDTSVVMASYDIGDNMKGIIGVVGPTRMDYAKVTARLSYFADSLTRMFGKELPSGDEEDKQEP